IPAYTRIVQKLYPDAVRGRIMSTIRMVQVAAILVVTPLAGWTLDHLGYRVLFPIGALMALAAALLFTRIQVDEGPLPPRDTKTFSDLGQILREDRRFVIYLISFALLGLGTMMSSPLYPIVQVDRLGLSYSQIGLLGLVESIMWLGSYLVWGRLLDRQGGVYILRLVCLITMFVPGAYIFAANGWMLLPAFVARGIIMAGFELGRINAGIQLAHRGRIIEYAALQSTTIGMRGIIAPLLGAALLRLGLPDTAVFALSVLLMACGWLLFGSVNAPKPTPQPVIEREQLRAAWPFRLRPPRP
ncbi:MAG: MFS transporter, partial [Caldilineaceae bacterium]